MTKLGRPPGPPKKTPWEKAIIGMARVSNNENPEWGDFVLEVALIHSRHHQFFDVSEINVLCSHCQPKNPKSWGSRTNLWVSQGWCKKTGIIVCSKTAAGNAHKLCQLESLLFEGKKGKKS